MYDADRRRCEGFAGIMADHAEKLRTTVADPADEKQRIVANALADLCECQSLLMKRAAEIR